MTPEHIKDLGTTAAGGAGGYGLLLSVKWELIQHGELIKLSTALLLMLMAYLAYRDRTPRNGATA